MNRYQFPQEKIYHSYNVENSMDMVRRRKLTWAEIGFAIYLRAKSKRFGNPFFLSDKHITQETSLSAKTFHKLRDRLQVKGVIKFDSFHGRGLCTRYTALDTFMTSTEKPTHLGEKPTRLGNKTCPNGVVLPIINKDSNKQDKKDFSIRDTAPLKAYL
jgi:hypothetical protein